MSYFIMFDEYKSWVSSIDYDESIEIVPSIRYSYNKNEKIDIYNTPYTPFYIPTVNEPIKVIHDFFIPDNFRVFDKIDMNDFSFNSLALLLMNLRLPKNVSGTHITQQLEITSRSIIYYQNGKLTQTEY